MSRRKQSNPQHLGLDRELPASTFENGPPPGDTPIHANAHQETGGADEVNGDVHVCGKCRGEFIIISEFLQHKQTCCKDPTVVIVNEGGHRNSENTDNHPQSKPEEVGTGEGGEGEINEDENEMRNKDDREDTKDKLEDGIKQSLTPEVPKSEAGESQEAMDFTVNQPIAKSESGRSPIANGLTSLSLPPSNLTLSNMEHTKYAVSQICQSLSPPTREDMAIIQEQLYTLQQQHLQQLQLIQHIQQQVNNYTAQQQKLEPPKSSSPSSTSSTPTLPTISLPSGSQVPPPPHLLSPPTSTTSVLPPSFDSLPPSHPSHRPGPPPPSGILPPGAFPLPPHRPPFELLQQAAIPPVSSPLHSVPPAPFGGPTGPGGLLGLHRKGKPPNVSIFDSKFAADDPFFRHKCRFCHKVFGSDSALQIHIRSHTGERPFKCNICGNRFSTKGNLKVHFQRHQARYPHIQMDTTPHPPSPPPQERPSQMGQPPIHPPSIHQVPMPTIPNDIAKLPVETTNASHQAVQPSSGSPNTSINSDEFPVKATTNEWHPPMASPNASSTVERPPRPLSEPPRPASEPARCSSVSRTAPETTRPASISDIAVPRSSLSPVTQRESPPSPPTFPTTYPQFMPPSSRPDDYHGSMSMEYSGTPSSLKLLAEQGFRPSETSKLQELVENIEQKITDPNQCVICHRVLSCKSALQMHYRIHTGERPFRCKVCSRSFTTKGNLKTHYGVHRTQPPIRTYHDCPICQKRFTNEIVLQQHLRLHAAEGIPIPNSMNFMRPQMGSYGPEIALQRPMPMMNGERLRQHDIERSERSAMMNRERLRQHDIERSERSAMMNGERPHHSDSERSERPMMMNGERPHHSDNERSERPMMMNGERPRHNDSERSEQPMMMNGERPRHNDNERSERPMMMNGERPRHNDSERSEQPMMMNGERPCHNDNERSEQGGTLTNGSGSLSNGPSLSNGQTSEEMLTREKNLGHEREKEVKDKGEDRMEDGEVADNGLTEKDIEEAMFTPSEPSQGDAASPPATFTEDSQQPPERQLLNHFERRPSEMELAHQHRYDHQRSLDNITNALKMKMASAPLNNNTEIRGPVSANEEQFSEPQSPFSKSEENSMTSEKPSDVQSFGEDNLEHPLHIDESRMDSNGVLDLTSRSSGETSPSMPQSQGLPTSTAAMFAGLGAPNLLLAQGPGGLIYPPGRRPTSNNTTCQFCGKVFACTSALQIHYRSHTKERPFKCDICGKGFSTRGNLKQHMLTHKIRDLPAQLFDPTLVQHSAPIVPLPPKVPEKPEVPKLEPEQKVDSQPVHPSLKRPSPPTSCENEPLMKRTLKHQCSVCEKQFQSDSALQIHMRTHTGEKPFKCHICGRAFTTKGNMKVHMGTHMWNGGTRRGRRIAFDPPLIISPKEGEVFRNDFLGMRPPFDGSFFQYPSPLNGFTALSKTNEISVIQNHQTGPQQAHIPESPNSVIMKADGPNPELRELRELREMQENKIREMHETSMRELHENSIREIHEKSFREMHENKIREMHESKMRELHENKIREMHENSIREMRENTIRELRENAMREMRENALREMRESTMREMRENAMRDLKPEAEPERLATA